MIYIPTAEQSAIISEAVGSSDNLIVSALAGAAKTSTLVMMAEAMPKVGMLCLAFNKKIAVEMQERLPSNCTAMTLNSLGHRTWADCITGRVVLKADKNYKILSELVGKLNGDEKDRGFAEFADTLKMMESGKSAGYIPTDTFPNAKRLMNDNEFFGWLEDEPSALQERLLREATIESIAQGMKGLIDFSDQILLPTVFPSMFPHFPLVMIDEAQDLSALNMMTLRKLAKKRLIAVGDQHQCHPPGTVITMSGGKRINIENVNIGDRVASLQLNNGWFGGMQDDRGSSAVLNKQAFDFNGELISIITEKAFHKCTPEHKCLVKFNETVKHCVYLMKRGHNFRVGTSKTLTESGQLRRQVGPVGRANAEQADAVWILSTHSTKEESLIQEKIVCASFGLPDVIFHCNSDISSISQVVLDKIWSIIGDNSERASICLESFGRMIDFPLWEKGTDEMVSRRPFITQACNLISEVMSVRFFDGDIRGNTWLPIEVKQVHYEGLVYGLTVEENKGGKSLYQANDITTHNSIYGFRGAHEDGMEKLKKDFNMRELTLSISFRCPKSVVAAALWRAPHMKYPEWAAEGSVTELTHWNKDTIPETAAILCRNNAPLFSMAIKLLKNGRYPQLVGGDVVKYLVKIMKKFGKNDLPRAEALIKAGEWSEEKLLKTRNAAKVYDQLQCMTVFLDQGETLGDAILYAEHICNSQGPIKLSTIHKAKGLEWDNVFILDKELINLEEGQERNLMYVAITRAKMNLFYVNSKDFDDDHDS